MTIFSWGALGEEFQGYLRVYGGIRSLLRSPWLWIAFVFTLVAWPFSSRPMWPDAAFSILPSLIGFSISAMAIVLAFPTGPVFKFLAEKGREDSYYMDVAAKFLHFILVQSVAFGLAFLAKGYEWRPLCLLGFWALSYAILTGAASGFALFGIAQIYNKVPPPGS